MELTRNGKKEVREFAKRFTVFRPPLCTDHAPDGLPIDEDAADKHHEQFTELVETELKRKGFNPETVEPAIRESIYGLLRREFADVYRFEADERACAACYSERKEDESGVDIRMEVPEEYDNISAR